MRKVVDITEKLSFDENPKLMIKGKEYEVNADARTMLEIMGLLNNENDAAASMMSYEKLFSEKDRKSIDGMKLSFKDLMTIIEEAMKLVRGEDDEGEDVTRTTT